MTPNQEETWLLTEKYNGQKTEAFFSDLHRLKDGEPLGYLIGHVPFLGCNIHLDSHPLIPRVETEYWVEEAIKQMKDAKNVLDLCAGSGCIGVAVAKHLPTVKVDFAELDTIHHQTILKNLKENSITKSRIFGGSLFEEVKDKYDFILSNPPYIDPELDRVSDSVRNFEPASALYGGEGGTKLIKEIIEQATTHLNPQGQLFLEHEPEQKDEIAKLAKEAGFSSIFHHPDQYGTIRYSQLVR